MKAVLKLSKFLLVITILLIFIFQIWGLYISRGAMIKRPDNLGNFKSNIENLKSNAVGEKIKIAVIGDSRSTGTFDSIALQLKNYKFDFAVLLGDIAINGSKYEHQWLLREIKRDWCFKFPLFYLIGNHDIDSKIYPVASFNRDYGPTVFSFEYKKCLFIFLRVWNGYGTDYGESLALLKKLSEKDLSGYRKRLVFMHQPPEISTLAPVKRFADNTEFVKLFKKMNIDYVFASDFHGYSWTKQDGIIYNITGGGGASLVKSVPEQFHHIILFEIGENFTSQQLIVIRKSTGIDDALSHFVFTSYLPVLNDNPEVLLIINIFMGFILFSLFFLPAELKSENNSAGKQS